jgi:hypothetical protein
MHLIHVRVNPEQIISKSSKINLISQQIMSISNNNVMQK